ncbi:MAG: DUF2141 domain-containing protein [Sphingobium sp.]
MLKVSGRLLAASVALAALPIAPTPASAAVLGPDAPVCAHGDSPSVLVRVEGFKTRSGLIRVQVYGSNPADFLAKGKKLKRVDLPVSPSGPMQICLALPQAGNIAIAVRHDLDGNGKSGWSDGGGFSRNPSLSLFKLKPDYRDVVVAVGKQTKEIDVVLKYRDGFSIQPVSS